MRLIGILYLVVGVLVASARGYLGGIDGLEDLVSAVLAIALWPLILVGIDLEIGRGGRDRRALLPLIATTWGVRPRRGASSRAAQ
jgi:hypothetical protein